MYVYVFVYVYVYVSVYTYIYIYVYICTYIYIHVFCIWPPFVFFDAPFYQCYGELGSCVADFMAKLLRVCAWNLFIAQGLSP